MFFFWTISESSYIWKWDSQKLVQQVIEYIIDVLSTGDHKAVIAPTITTLK